jgi:nucleoside-diphosphate-sugar epimerase
MIVIIGGRGRLGQALARAFHGSVTALDRSVYQDWWHPDAVADARRILTAPALGTTAIILAAGVLDPAADPETLDRVNLKLPQTILAAAYGTGIPVVTVGTVMEALAQRKNGYVSSKAMLADHVAALAADGAPTTHVRIHTLYGGGGASPFMFLGQMAHALNSGLPFSMTSGEQLREYHHVDDAAQGIRALVEAQAYGVQDLSYGNPIKLRALAEAVFEAFQKRDDLKIGALSQPIDENYGTIFTKNPHIAHLAFRDPIDGVVRYMKTCNQWN